MKRIGQTLCKVRSTKVCPLCGKNLKSGILRQYGMKFPAERCYSCGEIIFFGNIARSISEIQRLQKYENFLRERKPQLLAEGLTDEQAEFAMQPALLLYEQLKYDIEKKRPREGWAEAFKHMHNNGDDDIDLS
ncbi:hypothetical protein KL86SPO_50079 [uncultured Sporomusa sp.]|uniref:Uncharacterized protein n=1 Tax=uncultured Sporomusa sp. TaxID=307249 RepID=A0A212LXQ2_9FIRM|nr:hypothetical protein [uncultured Sporomusa sp.]SCM82308.1 hypothetical protein KL86SPO_50079 [uncultured Sporomusa sp.]